MCLPVSKVNNVIDRAVLIVLNGKPDMYYYLFDISIVSFVITQ